MSAIDGNDKLASFSSTGSKVELAAPGVSVLSTSSDGDYTHYNGSSMATPYVAAAGALVMANGFTNTEARSQLNETAEDIGLSENEQGNGLVDAGSISRGDPSIGTGKPTNVGGNSATILVDR